MIGFNVENHTVTEGVDMFTDITVDLLDGELGEKVVVTVSTQADTAIGKSIQGFYNVHTKKMRILCII